MQVVPGSDAPGDTMPLSIEPVLGWRVWRLGLDPDGGLVLRSTTRPDTWRPGSPMKARCYTHRGATLPSRTCTCGLYATSSPETLGTAGVVNEATVVVGAIAMWGTVVEHARGARSRFAYPARLAIVCGKCLADGRGAVAAAHVIDVGEGLMARCNGHLRMTAGARPAVEVQAELLSTYGVDVLPLERVSKALRRPRSSVGPPSVTLQGIVGGVIRAIGLVIQAVMFLWMASGFIALAAIVIGAVLGLFGPTIDPTLTPAVSAAEASLAGAAGEGSPSDGWLATAVPVTGTAGSFPEVAFLCGRSDGPAVHIVDCAEPADLWGFAAAEPPSGPERDCVPGWLAYTREPDRWICWHAASGETPDVRAWTSADGEWFDEDGG